MQDYEQLKNEILEKIDKSSTLEGLEDVRVESLGKKFCHNCYGSIFRQAHECW